MTDTPPAVVQVFPAGNPAPTPDNVLREVPAAPGSALSNLRQRVREMREKLYVDLKAPRWAEAVGSEVFVRYGAVDQGAFEKTFVKYGNADTRDQEATTLANAELLCATCRGIYVQMGSERVGLLAGVGENKWPTFASPTLYEELPPRLDANDHEMPDERSAIATCRRFYFTDGDLNLAAGALVDWSSKRSEEVKADFPTP